MTFTQHFFLFFSPITPKCFPEIGFYRWQFWTLGTIQGVPCFGIPGQSGRAVCICQDCLSACYFYLCPVWQKCLTPYNYLVWRHNNYLVFTLDRCAVRMRMRAHTNDDLMTSFKFKVKHLRSHKGGLSLEQPFAKKILIVAPFNDFSFLPLV